MIKNGQSNRYWNYFLALEHDLELTSRYIEFCEANLNVFSIELAHLLIAAASEVDVLAKCICEMIAPNDPRENIYHYRAAMLAEEIRPVIGMGGRPIDNPAYKPRIFELRVTVPQYGLSFRPWENWKNPVQNCRDDNPRWWWAYNKVKHERNDYFQEATLQNALNAMGGLLIMNYYHCRLVIREGKERHRWQYRGKIMTTHLQPEAQFMRLPETFYESIWAALGEVAMSIPSEPDPNPAD